MRAVIFPSLLLLALTGCIWGPKKPHPEAPAKTAHSAPVQSPRGAASAQKPIQTNSANSAKAAPPPPRTTARAAVTPSPPVQTPAWHAPAESASSNPATSGAVPANPPVLAIAPKPAPAPAAPPTVPTPAPLPPATEASAVAPGVDPYPVLEAAFRHVFHKLSISETEKKSTAAYLIQQGELTPKLAAAFVGNEPDVEEYRLPKGFDLDTYRQGTGLSIKVWTAQIQELTNDHARVKVSWLAGKRSSGAFLLTLQRANGKWEVLKEQQE